MVLQQGDLEAGFLLAEEVEEGVMEVGGQEHFYMECQTCLVTPKEKGGLDVFAACHWMTGLQVSHLISVKPLI